MKILSSIIFIFILISCDLDRNQPGYSYFPDMEQSRSYETYTENTELPDGKTMQPPVENTISREVIPFDFEKTDQNRALAGKYLNNPLQSDTAILEEGKRLYSIYCWHCHGEKGDGKGFLYTSGKYTFPPASLLADKIVNNPDGEIFHVISIGFGVMGEHQGQIEINDRWKIVSYIRNQLITENK